MARRRDKEEDFVDLGAPEHAWWTGLPVVGEPPVVDESTTNDTVPVEVAEELEPSLTDTDPYAVLRLPPTATWEEIVANYRRLARWWHPDGLGAAAEWGRAACEDKIRQLNAAYGELRIRRGR